MAVVLFVATPIAAVVGFITLVRILIGTRRRALVTDAIVCIACWGLGSYVFGLFGQLGAGDNAPIDKRIASGMFYGISCFLLGAIPIGGIAAIRYRLLSKRDEGSSMPPQDASNT